MDANTVPLHRDATFIDVLDRVLDKGIVIDFTVDVSVVGLSAIGVTGHVTIASIERYQRYGEMGIDLRSRELDARVRDLLKREGGSVA